MRFDDFCITDNYTLIEAIDIIRSNENRGVVVTNNQGKVIGFISQGDILEAVKNGISLYASISNILKSTFLYSNDKNIEKMIPIFREKLITIMPIVDSDFKLIDIVTLKDILELL